jgi:UPF0716 protein FxsA
MKILFLLFLVVPIAEIYVLIQASDIIGVGWTILAVIGTAVLGAFLVKTQGFFTLNRVQSKLAEGRVPAVEAAEGVAILFAGALLLTPGFVTDSFGFACLVPPLRRAVIKNMFDKGVVNIMQQAQHSSNANHSSSAGSQTKSGNVIDGEYRDQ